MANIKISKDYDILVDKIGCLHCARGRVSITNSANIVGGTFNAGEAKLLIEALQMFIAEEEVSARQQSIKEAYTHDQDAPF